MRDNVLGRANNLSSFSQLAKQSVHRMRYSILLVEPTEDLSKQLPDDCIVISTQGYVNSLLSGACINDVICDSLIHGRTSFKS